VRRERGGRHELRVGGVQRQERFGVLPGLTAQRDRDQVHHPHTRHLGRWRWHFPLCCLTGGEQGGSDGDHSRPHDPRSSSSQCHGNAFLHAHYFILPTLLEPLRVL